MNAPNIGQPAADLFRQYQFRVENYEAPATDSVEYEQFQQEIGKEIHPEFDNGEKWSPAKKRRVGAISSLAVGVIVGVGVAVAAALLLAVPFVALGLIPLAIAGIAAGILWKKDGFESVEKRKQEQDALKEKRFQEVMDDHSMDEILGYGLLDGIADQEMVGEEDRTLFYHEFKHLGVQKDQVVQWKKEQKETVTDIFEGGTQPLDQWKDQENEIVSIRRSNRRQIHNNQQYAIDRLQLRHDNALLRLESQQMRHESEVLRGLNEQIQAALREGEEGAVAGRQIPGNRDRNGRREVPGRREAEGIQQRFARRIQDFPVSYNERVILPHPENQDDLIEVLRQEQHTIDAAGEDLRVELEALREEKKSLKSDLDGLVRDNARLRKEIQKLTRDHQEELGRLNLHVPAEVRRERREAPVILLDRAADQAVEQADRDHLEAVKGEYDRRIAPWRQWNSGEVQKIDQVALTQMRAIELSYQSMKQHVLELTTATIIDEPNDVPEN